MVADSLDPYYDLLATTTYEEVIDFETLEEGEESPWTVEASDTVNIEFTDSKVILEQSKPLDKQIKKNNQDYRVIIDTQKTMGIELNDKNEYSSETSDMLGFNDNDMVVYITDTFVIMRVNGNVISYTLDQFTGDFESTESIYHFLKENYVNKSILIQFSMITSLFLFTMYYIVVYFLMRSILKRDKFEISNDRKFRIIFYTMQPGLYVYITLAFIMQTSNFALSFVVPLVSVITMMFINIKTLEQVKDFVKKEQKAEKRLKHRSQ